jgi:hypothetical protein
LRRQGADPCRRRQACRSEDEVATAAHSLLGKKTAP